MMRNNFFSEFVDVKMWCLSQFVHRLKTKAKHEHKLIRVITVHKLNKSDMRRCCGVICLTRFVTFKLIAIHRLCLTFITFKSERLLIIYHCLLAKVHIQTTTTWHHWRALFLLVSFFPQFSRACRKFWLKTNKRTKALCNICWLYII